MGEGRNQPTATSGPIKLNRVAAIRSESGYFVCQCHKAAMGTLCEFANVRNRAAQFFVLKEISIALKRTFANRHYRPIPAVRTHPKCRLVLQSLYSLS